jgi:hypothetical protein
VRGLESEAGARTAACLVYPNLREGDDRDFENFIEAALALMEYVAGVRLTFARLQSARYLCGTALLPHR